jgi:hypothetical protein
VASPPAQSLNPGSSVQDPEASVSAHRQPTVPALCGLALGSLSPLQTVAAHSA